MAVKTRTADGKIPVGVRFIDEEYEALRQVAFEKNQTVNTLIVSTMREMLEEREEELRWFMEESTQLEKPDDRNKPVGFYLTQDEYETLRLLAGKYNLSINEYMYFLFKKEEAALNILRLV